MHHNHGSKLWWPMEVASFSAEVFFVLEEVVFVEQMHAVATIKLLLLDKVPIGLVVSLHNIFLH